MIEGLKPYAEYKESGQAWLGSVPVHWSLLPNRAIFDEVKDRNNPKEEMLSVTITRGIVRQKALLDGSSKKDSSNLNKGAYKLVQPNDIAYNKMRAWQGALGVSALRGIISPAYVVMRPRKEMNPFFYHQLYRTPLFAKEAERWSYGITSDMWSLRPEHFKVIGSVLPPPEEQSAIVRFLDHANRKIDGFIRAKRKLIGLLNEQKHAIIHRAVTRGLDHDVKLKPSGIPWLTEAPAHWTWIPIKLLLSRMDYGTSEKSTASGIIRILTMGNIQKGEVTVPQSGGLNSLPESLLLQHHDLLFTRTNGNPNLVGKVGIFRGEVAERISFASYLVRLRVKRDYDPEWLHMVLNSVAFWPFAQSHALVNLQTNLNSTRYGQFSVPVPPLAEQKEIVKWVSGESENLNAAITRTEREIALMQEYRTRLTADIVTGKLDVREAAAKLPDLSPDTTPESITDDEALDETETEES
ncbi:MAG: type I restriction enzyme S subunit [Comamonadaceae bacterium]|nr:MAG: type I restriction enzyme S subunit [Comamonadaceae bacterium]